jgi:hypothetical protein
MRSMAKPGIPLNRSARNLSISFNLHSIRDGTVTSSVGKICP